MFKEIFVREIVTALKRPMIYIFFLLIAILVGGAVASDSVTIGASIGKIHKNAPHVVYFYTSFMTFFGLLIATAFFNNAALRDFQYGFHEILFSTPMKKTPYLMGRFLGAWVLSTLPLCGVYLGFIAGAAIGPAAGWLEASRIGPTAWDAFFKSYWLFIVPNMFVAGTITFVLANRWRSTVVSFIGALVVIAAWLISGTLLSDLDNETLAALTDLFGIRTYALATKYFTPIEKNTLAMGFEGLLAVNRVFWVAVGAGIFALSYFTFSFRPGFQKAKKLKLKLRLRKEKRVSQMPLIERNFGPGLSFGQFFSFFKMNFLSIVKSNTYRILFIFSAILLISTLKGGFEYFGLQSYPVTYKVIGDIRGITAIFVVIVMVFFSGELIWRDRDAGINEVIDVTPHSSGLSLAAKTLSLLFSISILNLFFMLVGVIYQLSTGYTDIKLDLYLLDFLASDFPRYLIWSMLFIFIHVLINQKYIGYFVSVLLLFGSELVMSIFDLQSNMLEIGGSPFYTLSAMNGFGPNIGAKLWFNLYWVSFGLVFLTLAGLLWVRGKHLGIKDRLKTFRKQLNLRTGIGLFGSLVIWFGLAGFVFYNTQVLNPYHTRKENEKARVKYEKTYKKYEGRPHPVFTSAKFEVDIFPEDRNLEITSHLGMLNKSGQNIDSLHFILDDDWNMKLEIPGAELVFEDEELDYYIYQLTQPLAPGGTMSMRAHSSFITEGFANNPRPTWVVQNGSFFNNSDFMPQMGYSSRAEIGDKNTREKYDLPPKPRMPKLEEKCSEFCMNNYLTDGGADWVEMETIISTSPDQIAIAPGTLKKEWEKDGRRYFQYEVDHPSMFFASFLSARFEVLRRKWKGVDIEVYYHKEHEVNVAMMADAIERALDYYTTNFGPYYHKQARIIEFPGYASFAQAFPGTMPYSEALGFVVDLEDETDNNVVDAVIAHEMAHQWWAHQVIGAKMQGATMFSESFAEYSSLMVMKKALNDDIRMKKFLKYDFDRYLRGRSREVDNELPLYKVENQGHIHYGKGSVVMYALQDYIGEEKVNEALRVFLEKFRYEEPPYPTSLDFLATLDTIVPDSQQYLIEDWFRRITLYDFRMEEATWKKMPSGKYEVEMQIFARQLEADSLGNETEVPLDHWVDIGVFADEDEEELIYVDRVKFDREDLTFTVELDEKPAKAAVDPRRMLVERIVKDNVKTISEME